MTIRLLRVLLAVWFSVVWNLTIRAVDGSIPLPEHPRPDFQRAAWLNLNGPWQFRFDKEDRGLGEKWFEGRADFPKTILVPFPWGSALSEVRDEAPVAWYAREVRLPEEWQGRRVFLVIGACDWETRAWLDGEPVGTHRGGYIPFEFELTRRLKPGQGHRLVFRVDDTARAFKLEGKQGYGNARGIWQTVYIEARPQTWLESLHFAPDLDQSKVIVTAGLSAPAPAGAEVKIEFKTGGLPEAIPARARGRHSGPVCGFDTRRPALVAGRPVSLRGRGRLARGRRRRPCRLLLRHEENQRRQCAGPGLSLHRAERRADLPADDSRSVLSSRGVLHLPERWFHAG